MSTLARFSTEQYEAMVATGCFEGANRRRIELIHGELREMAAIGPTHAYLVDVLAEWSIGAVPLDQILVRIQNPIGIPALDSVPEPDLAWLVRKNYAQSHPTAADVLLLIEVADKSLTFDTGEKAELYARAGIADYWVVNIRKRRVEVRRDPRDGTYGSVEFFKRGDAIQPLAFPQLTFDVERLFS